DPLDCGAAAPAALALAGVHPGAALEVPEHAVGADVIAQARAAGADGGAQRLLDGSYQLCAVLQGKAVGALARIDAGAEQAFRSVDVADADDAPRVHEELLDRHAASK